MNSLKNIIILLISALFIGTFPACTKEQTKPVENKEKKTQDSRITRNLLAFKANLLQKSTGSMEMDSAIWYIEGILNLDNANNPHKFINAFSLKDSMVVIPINGSVTTDQINEVYFAFQNKLDAATGSNSTIKADAVDIYVSPTILKDGSQTFYLEATIGEEDLATSYQPFGPNDNWFWTNNAGRCTGGGTPYDARILLQNRFNNPVGSSEIGYFTDVSWAYLQPYAYPDPTNPVGGYMIFANGLYNPLTCIGYQELNYYLSVFDYLINDNLIPGKSFSNVIIKRDVILINPPVPDIYSYWMYYGVFHEGLPPQ
ncbi:MAG: hypothetical protein Q8M08_13855 [Bacteroidales bacterium]|nr:hypothetical protein [Bacteroidales bacterium]